MNSKLTTLAHGVIQGKIKVGNPVRKTAIVAKGNFKFPFIFGLFLSINERN